jgi:hypothetical protein
VRTGTSSDQSSWYQHSARLLFDDHFINLLHWVGLDWMDWGPMS